MSSISVQFRYLTGLPVVLSSARLVGSWDSQGRFSDQWSTQDMELFTADDGCPALRATVEFDASGLGRRFQWGVFVDGPGGGHRWGITSEVGDRNSTACHRSFVLQPPEGVGVVQEESYYLTHCRRLGAQKRYRSGGAEPGVRFAVWAPNARRCEVVMGAIWRTGDRERQYPRSSLPVDEIAGGYVADEGSGSLAGLGPFPMARGKDGVWETSADEPSLQRFADLDHRPYMFRITRDDGSVVYRTDLYSRCQIGSGRTDPNGGQFTGPIRELDGTVSCSVIVDPDRVAHEFEEAEWPERQWDDPETFWRNEFTAGRPVPYRVEDLVIYELHLGALGFGREDPGTLRDAIELLDYLEDLGVNAVELLPMSEFGGNRNWGYATSHYFAIEYSGGGRDKFKHFVRDCHRRGIAVIMDVVYNHYVHKAERAQWMYDSTAHERNIYYWYEGQPRDYPDYETAATDVTNPDRPTPSHGGYIDNMSTGYAPRYHEEMVRRLFVSSAAALISEFHVDGLRVDQTTSIHLYNVRHGDGVPVADANMFGAKLLRELTSTLRLIRSNIILMAEDHSDWEKVTEDTRAGGLGFDARWYADFYHHLVGDTDKGSDFAKLLKTAGLGDNRPLAMDYFAAALGASGGKRVTYSESHDEAGNGKFTQRSIVVAVNGAPLVSNTRRCAESRCRFAFGMTALSAGTPLFLFGEEVGTASPFLYDRVLENKIDLGHLREAEGSHLFAFYGDLIRLRLRNAALRSYNIEVLHVHNANRVIAFRRWTNGDDFLVVGTLSNRAYAEGYEIQNARLPAGQWREVFNSDAEYYGGDGVGNAGAAITVEENGLFRIVLPRVGVVAFHRQ